MDGGGRLPRSVKTMAAKPEMRLPVPVQGPQLLVGERSGRWLKRSRRAAETPLAERLPRSLGTWLALGVLALSAGTGTVLGGHLDRLQENYGEPRHMMARLFGFGIERVTIAGIKELSEIEVLVAAGIDPNTSLAFYDADEGRRRLEATPMVREATVRKLYPGEVSITLTEREPFALWQVKGELFVIAADGTVIDKMDDGRFAHLPLVVGDEANIKAKDYIAIRQEAGKLAGQIRAGTLVAGRRWNLKLDNGMDVRLPEIKPGEAVKRLAALEGDCRLFEKDIMAIDLRQTDRVVMRLTEEGASARAEMLKNKSKKKGGEA